MPTAQHTPGPWEHLGTDSDGSGYDIVAAGPDDLRRTGPLALVGGWGKMAEQNANARLIASAPDLLAACRKLREALASITFAGGDPLCVRAALDASRLAIHAATGKDN